MGAKLVSFYPGNAGTSDPTHFAVIVLFETDHGRPLAVMDGRLITEMRTAAVSAAVTKLLAPPDSCKLALLGSGVQAKAHLEALRQIFDFDDVRVWSRTPAHARRFAETHGAKAMDLEDAVRNADIVLRRRIRSNPFSGGVGSSPARMSMRLALRVRLGVNSMMTQ